MKEEINQEDYAERISWKESDDEEYDVRDLIAILEAFNIFDFPNEVNAGKHPIAAYEKWSTPLTKFARDYEENKEEIAVSTYHRLRLLLRDGLALYDRIRRDFREMHNDDGGRAGKMNIVEEASERRGAFDFPFANLPSSKYRLTKGARFRSSPLSGLMSRRTQRPAKLAGVADLSASLRSGRMARVLVDETFQLTTEGIRNPDQIGKNRKHWANLYMRLQVRLLQERLQEEREKTPARRRR